MIAGSHGVIGGELRSWDTYAAIHLPYVAPNATHMAFWVPQARPVRIVGVRASIRARAPEIGYFARARRAGGSRRRGRLASQDWATARLAIQQDPGRHPARVDLSVMEVGGRSLLLDVGFPLAPSTSDGAADVVVPPTPCQVAEEIRIYVTNRDYRSMAITLELRLQEEA